MIQLVAVISDKQTGERFMVELPRSICPGHPSDLALVAIIEYEDGKDPTGEAWDHSEAYLKALEISTFLSLLAYHGVPPWFGSPSPGSSPFQQSGGNLSFPSASPEEP